MIRLTQVPKDHSPKKESPFESFEYWMNYALPPKFARKAIEEPVRRHPYGPRRERYPSASTALLREFNWSRSSLGYSFWIKVHRHLDERGALPPSEGD